MEVADVEVDDICRPHVFYESGLAINLVYGLGEAKRAVGFKLCEGMDVPEELASKFKFARQKSKLAGTIRVPTSTSKTSTRAPASGLAPPWPVPRT